MSCVSGRARPFDASPHLLSSRLTPSQVLHEHGFPVPQPIDHARHCVVMELIDAFPLHVALCARTI